MDRLVQQRVEEVGARAELEQGFGELEAPRVYLLLLAGSRTSSQVPAHRVRRGDQESSTAGRRRERK